MVQIPNDEPLEENSPEMEEEIESPSKKGEEAKEQGEKHKEGKGIATRPTSLKSRFCERKTREQESRKKNQVYQEQWVVSIVGRRVGQSCT